MPSTDVSIITLTSVTYAPLDLYPRPEYVEIIRSGLQNTPLESLSGQTDDLPILDVLLKEFA